MAIYTRFGMPFEIQSAKRDLDHFVWVKGLRTHNGVSEIREYTIDELRADGGIEEITQAVLVVAPELQS